MLPRGLGWGSGSGIEQDNSPQLCPMTAECCAPGQRCPGLTAALSIAASGLGSLQRKPCPVSGGSGTEEDCMCHHNHLSKGLQLNVIFFPYYVTR